jgi:hypothetical protein
MATFADSVESTVVGIVVVTARFDAQPANGAITQHARIRISRNRLTREV